MSGEVRRWVFCRCLLTDDGHHQPPANNLRDFPASGVMHSTQPILPHRPSVLRFNHAHLTSGRTVCCLRPRRLIRLIILLPMATGYEAPPSPHAADQRLRRRLRPAGEVNGRVRPRLAAVEAGVRLLLRPMPAVEVSVLDLQVNGAESELHSVPTARVAFVPAPDSRVPTFHVGSILI